MLDDCQHDTLGGKNAIEDKEDWNCLHADRGVGVVLHLINGNKLRHM